MPGSLGETPPIPMAEPRHLQSPLTAAESGRLGSAPPMVEPSPAQPEDPYTRAVALSRAGLHAEAAEAFENVANGHAPHADLALAALGRIEQVQLGRSDRALAAYLRYQREFPRGTLSQEVALSTIELQLQRHELDAARAQMNRFLEQFAGSERAPEVHLLRGDVLREQGDCRHALDDYARASGPAQADDALYFTAWCQQHLGRRDDAAQSCVEYLRRFPQGRHAGEARTALPAAP
jgi:TolA-binding protein